MIKHFVTEMLYKSESFVHSITFNNNDAALMSPSRKHACDKYTHLNPTFMKQNWGMLGHTYFSYFCSKTKIVATR